MGTGRDRDFFIGMFVFVALLCLLLGGALTVHSEVFTTIEQKAWTHTVTLKEDYRTNECSWDFTSERMECERVTKTRLLDVRQASGLGDEMWWPADFVPYGSQYMEHSARYVIGLRQEDGEEHFEKAVSLKEYRARQVGEMCVTRLNWFRGVLSVRCDL